MSKTRTKGIYIIAEAGVNHNGNIAVAERLVDAASSAGADAIKFQTFRADDVITQTAAKADYQKKNTGSKESQYGMLKRLELGEDDHLKLLSRAQRRRIDFMSTPFDVKSLDLLTDVLGLRLIKVPSGELTNAPLLLKIAKKRVPVILSTGMSTLKEIEAALGVLAFGYAGEKGPSEAAFKRAYKKHFRRLVSRVTLLHCTTEYPAPYRDANLRAMATMRRAFSLPVGISDHTEGIAVSVAAAALGAVVIEKHLTLDKKMKGPDHRASLEPDEFRELVSSVRAVEEALGSGKKAPFPSEVKNIKVARRSLVADRAIKKGELFSEADIAIKRPGSGLSPFKFWSKIGCRAASDYSKDDIIK